MEINIFFLSKKNLTQVSDAPEAASKLRRISRKKFFLDTLCFVHFQKVGSLLNKTAAAAAAFKRFFLVQKILFFNPADPQGIT